MLLLPGVINQPLPHIRRKRRSLVHRFGLPHMSHTASQPCFSNDSPNWAYPTPNPSQRRHEPSCEPGGGEEGEGARRRRLSAVTHTQKNAVSLRRTKHLGNGFCQRLCDALELAIRCVVQKEFSSGLPQPTSHVSAALCFIFLLPCYLDC